MIYYDELTEFTKEQFDLLLTKTKKNMKNKILFLIVEVDKESDFINRLDNSKEFPEFNLNERVLGCVHLNKFSLDDKLNKNEQWKSLEESLNAIENVLMLLKNHLTNIVNKHYLNARRHLGR